MPRKLVVCDLSSIETRVTGWVAGCAGILNVFKEKRDAYIDFGTRWFGQSYDLLNPDYPGISAAEKANRKDLRQLCKPAVLGCCYGLGGGDYSEDKNGDEIKTGLFGYSDNMGIPMTREQAHEAVDIYRRTYPEVCNAWRKLERAAVLAVETGQRQIACGIFFDCVSPSKLLYVTLPSGRRLHYIRPKLTPSEYGAKLSYENNILGGWGRTATWGGKFTENVVQAIARDVLAVGMLRARDAGFTIVGHTHDEIICEEEMLGLEQLRELMIAPMPWAPDLLLDADGYEDTRYHK